MNPVVRYFNEEKAESYLFIITGVIALAITLYLTVALKTSFWKGFVLPLALVAVLEVAGGLTIMLRSPKDVARVAHFVNNEPHNIKAMELPRMKTVMRNFVTYRTVEIALIVVSLFLMFGSSTYGFAKGAGMGLLVQCTLVICLDFFAERRAHIYLDYLKQFAENI